MNSKKCEDYFAGSLDAMRHFLHRSSAVGPILVVILIIGILTAMSFGITIKAENFLYLSYGLALLFGLAVIAFIGVFIYFAMTNPRVLQSEECQITMRQMDLAVASRGCEPSIEFNVGNTVLVEKGEVKPEIDVLASATDENAVMGAAE